MAFLNLLDLTVDVHRPSATTDVYGDVLHAYPKVGVPLAGYLEPLEGALRDQGPGEHFHDRRRFFTIASADVRPRDVLKITAGPQGGRWRVVSEPSRPRGHHTEVMVEPFHGDTP